MKHKFMDHAKIAGITAGEVAVVGGSMILTKKFLDFNVLFKNQIAKDPKYADKWFIKHQGAIKLVAGALAASYIKNPWLKLAFIGIAAEGFITEVRTLTQKADGTNFFDSIGSVTMSGEESELDKRIKAAAIEAENNMTSGLPEFQQNPTELYPTAVGFGEMGQQLNTTERFPTGVGAGELRLIPGIDSDNGGSTGVGMVMMSGAA